MGFEQLRVYQAAQRLDNEARRLMSKVGRGHASDLDQLGRSAGSVRYNIAEACGAEGSGKKRNHLAIARGEADESRAVLRRLVDKGQLTTIEIRVACGLTSVIARMLTSWMEKIE
jgi:four helix bundle protein